MINQIIRFSIQNKFIIGLLTVALIVGGIWSIQKVPLDAVPDITNNQVQIITQAPNLATEDIEQFVTYPVELAMANLPGVTEIRSVSRFGLSLVTIVFEDDIGTYLPRQLVSEKLNAVKKEIPKGFGVPEMGPISTGLGEIYQYTLQVDSVHKDKYSSSDLRTIQDWIIRRQMAMVPGVVEVNAFGGDIKQYEVAIDPNELNAIGITISEVFEALKQNNQNTGGAYIEKDHYANFIRGEGLARSIEDIEQIVVKNDNGVPITIKDVSKVQFGHAIKYGALTMDGEGEAVGGMILMLKGANSNEVIKAVKKRVEEIQKSLPEGITIEPFLDRSSLISTTTQTVSKNLLEGALIVIFVLVFLLGNWRGGLIVASTIPLSLLFAFILMQVFGVWANLMSLGAIDFGIIVDGAVIIVEGTVFLLQRSILKSQNINGETKDELAFKASSKMMNAAFFGQLIVLIVFIPILGLEGIEGKMFKPMALTFMFAMIGVMILCLTYVPMMSAWFLKGHKRKRKSWGDRLVEWLENGYKKLLQKSFKLSKIVVIVAVSLLGVSAALFNQMGGEFMPKLDEGDIAFHAILKPGTALTETVKTTTKIEQIVKSKFPEVKHIVSRIGVADVPTDPMPMDIADVFVILKPESEWVSAGSKSELIAKMKKAVQQVPGINFEFTQPIEMRFNELITGVREDVAIKLFGDDLAVLATKIEEIGKIIAPISGIGDMKVEAINGLPQITVKYNRKKLAQYGIQVNTLNTIIESAFAGGNAGVIFEGEKRFDLVVRLDESHRKSIKNIESLFVNTANGSPIPLRELADISYQSGSMQTSRDNTNRRVYVGVNVRGRDVKSLVEEIKVKLNNQLELPPGYYVRYGGTFENLERANDRLKILVPVALGLIFLLIFLALKSFKQSIMIYVSIPFAAIGGIFFLWLRGMPFSISAGVGFIVLFGIAVLNGLVLISGWNELKQEGVTDLNQRIKLGAKRRIRPILLTALTDILGFLPMAISTSAGAEVQQPLATVVIGGMLTATFLTLFVLPILYRWMENRENKHIGLRPVITILCVGLLVLGPNKRLYAQDVNVITTVEKAIEIGLENNGKVKVARLENEQSQFNKSAAINIEKTNVDFQIGQYNSFENDVSFNISQRFKFPTVYSAQWDLAKTKIEGQALEMAVVKNKLAWQIREVWNEISFLYEQEKLLQFQDSLYEKFQTLAQKKYELGATHYLEKVSAEAKLSESQNALSMLKSNILIQKQQLLTLMNDTANLTILPDQFQAQTFEHLQDSSKLNNNPLLSYTKQQIDIAKAKVKVRNAEILPDFSVGYFNQSMIGSLSKEGTIATLNDRFTGVQFGISIPLFFGSYNAKIKTARIEEDIAEVNANYYETILLGQFREQLQTVIHHLKHLNYYKAIGIPQSDLIIDQAQKSYEYGEISYADYFVSLKQGIEIKEKYNAVINEYNKAVINLQYLLGQ